MSEKPVDIEFILERIAPGNTGDSFALYACRGAGKGCKRNSFRKTLKHCDDCVPASDENMTIGDFLKTVQRGDA